jgi:hypothetical protein
MSKSSALLGAALMTGALILAASAQAGNTVRVTDPGPVTGATNGGLQLTALRCEPTKAPADFPYAKITNQSGATIAKGKTISYKFSSGKHSTMVLQADLPNQGVVVSPVNDEAGFKCQAKIL